MKKVSLTWLCLLLMPLTAFAQGNDDDCSVVIDGQISGPSEVIACEINEYILEFEENSEYPVNELAVDWSIDNGEIVSIEIIDDKHIVEARAFGTALIKADFSENFSHCEEHAGRFFQHAIVLKGFPEIQSTKFNIINDDGGLEDISGFLCDGETYNLQLEVPDHYNKMQYVARFQLDNDTYEKNFSGFEVNIPIGDYYSGQDTFSVKIYKQHRNCPESRKIYNPSIKWPINESSCGQYQIDIFHLKCHGEHPSEARIEISNLPDAQSSYHIELTKYSTENPETQYGMICKTNGININHIGRSGTSYSFDETPTENKIIIDGKNINAIPKDIGVTPGIYRLHIELEGYCNYREFFEIQEPAELSLDGVSPVNSYTYNNETFHMQTPEGTGGIHLELSGGTPGYTYTVKKKNSSLERSYSSNNREVNIQNLPKGSYLFEIADQYNCPYDSSNSIPEEIELIAPDPLIAYKKNFTLESPSCHKDVDTNYTNTYLLQNGEVIMRVQGGIGPYTGNLTNQKTINREFTTDENNDDPYALHFSNLPEGTYNYSLQDRFEHTVIEDQLVLVSPLPVTLKTKTIYPTICLGGNDGRLVVEPDLRSASDSVKFSPESPNSQKFTYNRYPGYSFEKLNEGYFEYRIKDSLDCIFTFTDSIPPNPNPPQLFIVDSTEISCFKANDGTVTLTGENGAPGDNNQYYFSLDGFNSIIHSTDDTARFNLLKPGKHNVFIDDTSECRNKQVDEARYKTSFYVEEPDKLDLKLSIADVAAYGDSTGSYLFSMSGGNGRYEYLAGRGEDTLQWGVMESDSIQLRSLPAGIYWLYYRDTCGCTNSGEEWAEESFQIEQPDSPLEFTATVIPPSCHGAEDGMVELTGTGGWDDYRYGLDTTALQESPIFGSLPAGEHTFWVEDRKGVRFSKSIHVSEPEPLKIEQIQILGPTCNGYSDGRINLQVHGGTPAYTINEIDSQDGAFQLTGYSAGTIHLEIADSNGCVLQMDTTLHEPERLNMTSELQKATCGEANGTIALTSVEGGTAPYSYSWYKNGTPVGTDSILQDVPSGFYELLLEDAGGCRLETSFQLDNIEGPEGAVLTTEAASCHGNSDGKVEMELIHCHHPGVYQLFKDSELLKEESIEFSSGNFQEELAAGSYMAVFLDSNACRTSLPFEITEPQPLQVQQVSLQNPLCHDAATGSIRVEPGGGNGGYTYSWNDTPGSAVHDDIPAGSYELQVQDQKGCRTDTLLTLTNPPALQVDLGGEATICGGQDYRFEPGDFTSYAWYRNDSLLSTDRNFTTQEEGRYLLEVESKKGCTATDSFRLKISNDLLEADFLVPSPVETGDTLVAIDISWPAPDSVYWVFPDEALRMESEEFMETFRFEEPGTYTLSLNAVKGECRDGISKTILVKQEEGDSDELKTEKQGNIRSCTIYPNPVRDVFHCELELEQPQSIRVVLLHAGTGQLVILQELMGRTDNTFSFDLGGKQAGNYLLVIQSGEEKIQRTILHL